MSERPLATLSREVSLETPAPAFGQDPGTPPTLLHDGGTLTSPGPLHSRAGSQQLSPWRSFGFALLLHEYFQLPLPKSAVCGPMRPSFGLVPVIFSILHNLRLVQDVSLVTGQAPSP